MVQPINRVMLEIEKLREDLEIANERTEALDKRLCSLVRKNSRLRRELEFERMKNRRSSGANKAD